jgi:predicted acetyltransferase
MESKDFERQYKHIWKIIFKDKESFIDMYFNNFFSLDDFYYVEKDNKPISMLLSVPYNYCYNEKLYPFAYLSGILTKEEYRKQGLCEELIKNTLNSLYRKDYLLCGLIAASNDLVSYYKKFSFNDCCFGEQGVFTKKQINNVLVDNYVLEEHQGYFFNGLLPLITKKENAISHTKQTLNLYNEKPYLSFVVGYQYTSRAMAIGIKEKDCFEVLDISYHNMEAREALLSHLAFKFKRDIVFSCYNTKAEKLPFQMIRIINAKKALTLYAERHVEKTMKIHIKDDIIKENNITVLIQDGQITEIPNSYSIPVISIEELTKQIFSPSYLFLMMDK